MTNVKASGLRRAAKAFIWIVLALVVVVALGFRPDRPAAALNARYATPPSRFVLVDGMRVHYRDRGNGPALVLLHGSNASLFTWEGWVDLLTEKHRVVTLDLPGHGLTGPDPAGRYSPTDMAAFVARFVQTIGLSRFSLGGNSMGGGVAWRYALLHPEQVDKLILVDAAGFPQPRPGVMKLYATPIVGHVVRWVTPRFMVKRSLRQVYGDPRRLTDDTVERYDDLIRRDGNREATRERLSREDDDGLLARLGEVRTPTLILWGGEDRWIPPDRADRFARTLPNARKVMLDGLGHIPMEEDPGRSVAPVESFLDGK